MTIAGAIHVGPGALRLVASANIRTLYFGKGRREKRKGGWVTTTPTSTATATSTNKERGNTKARGRRGRKNVLVSVEGWNNCRGAWLPCQASLILGASQPRVWNHRNAPINLILPFAGVRLSSSPASISLPSSTVLRRLSCIRPLAARYDIVYPRLGNHVSTPQLSRDIPNFYGNHNRAEFLDDNSMDPLLGHHCEHYRYADKSGEVENLSLY